MPSRAAQFGEKGVGNFAAAGRKDLAGVAGSGSMNAGFKEIAALGQLKLEKGIAAMDREQRKIGARNVIDDKGDRSSIRRQE